MRVERIARDKVRIFVSYEDLEERGIDRNEIWQNGRKVQELFWDMMETAYVEVGFEIAGPIAVEAFTMPTEGVVVIVTRIPNIPGTRDDDDELDAGDDFANNIETPLIYRFQDFEDLIHAAHSLGEYLLESSLFSYKGEFYIIINDALVMETYQTVASLLAEYGEVSTVSEAVLDEYGVCVLSEDAISTVIDKFSLS